MTADRESQQETSPLPPIVRRFREAVLDIYGPDAKVSSIFGWLSVDLKTSRWTIIKWWYGQREVPAVVFVALEHVAETRKAGGAS